MFESLIHTKFCKTKWQMPKDITIGEQAQSSTMARLGIHREDSFSKLSGGVWCIY